VLKKIKQQLLQDLFAIDATTGTITFVNAPNYEYPIDLDANNNYDISVIVTDASGLTDNQDITVTVIDVLETVVEIESNDLVTPNGDGINDYWVVENSDDLIGYDLYIYNNLGETIYKMKSYDNKWDAKYNGNTVANGTYYYMFKKGKDIFKGVITIMQ